MSLSIEQVVDAWTGRAGDDAIDEIDVKEFLSIFAEQSAAILASGLALSEDDFFADLDEPPGPFTSSATGINIEDYVGTNSNRNEEIVKKGFLAKIKKYLSRMPKAREAVAMYFAMLDSVTPLWVRAIIAGALAYFILPWDALPDVLFPFGLTDDIAVLAAAFALVTAFVARRHYDQADSWLDSDKSDRNTKR